MTRGPQGDEDRGWYLVAGRERRWLLHGDLRWTGSLAVQTDYYCVTTYIHAFMPSHSLVVVSASRLQGARWEGCVVSHELLNPHLPFPPSKRLGCW